MGREIPFETKANDKYLSVFVVLTLAAYFDKYQ